ncbi:MAG: phosphoenolpyruvate carboxylase, partial [Bdellovibrionales bacterium]|nr:phosphoenolpyruvate carboxylase [Bdellovibrionales bacterium]
MPSTNSKSTKPLRDNIRDLGQRLGRVLAECDSPELLEEVELVRRWAKDFRRGKRGAKGSLDNFLTRAEYEKSFKIARSFTEFLRLANAAEQYHRIRRRHYYETHSKSPQKGSVESFLKNLKPSLHKEVFKKLNSMEIDLVITAHPTESMRQSAIRRYKHVTQNLAVLDRKDATRWEIEMAKTSINRNIRALWLTEIIQEKGPTPFTEALTGFSIVEEVLWDTVPRYYRRLDALSRKYLGGELGCDAVPIRFSSWVGGDRDGNPNVTATVTKSILYQGMRKAYRLILSEVEWLQKEMSFNMASDELLDLLPEGDRTEPYRIFLSQLRRSIESSERLIEEGQANYDKCVGHLIGKSEIIDQLKVIYRSLVAIGAEDLAQGRTLDLIRRLEVFGVALLGLDIRQCSDVHEEVIGELASAEEEPLSYAKLSEREKQTYLIERLEGKKPIIESMKWSSLGKEVLETCRLINDFPEECFR